MFPKGIRVRPTPDWFVRYLSTMGYGIPQGTYNTPTYQAISLYNNASNGANLYMWGISLIESNTDFANVTFANGAPGAVVASGIRVNPSQGAPPGQLYYAQNGTAPWNFTPVTTIPSFVAGPGAYNYPIAVIPPGQAMIIWSPLGTDEFVVSCWYIPMMDLVGRSPV